MFARDPESPLELLATEAMWHALAASGWYQDDDPRMIRNAAGERRWWDFGCEENEIIEPEPGTVARGRIPAPGGQATVAYRGPGHVRVEWRTRKGNPESAVLMTGEYAVVPAQSPSSRLG